MTGPQMHDFGAVPEHGDSFEFFIDRTAGGRCHLVGVVQTERGPRRSELADIPGALWRRISVRVVRELGQDMHDEERTGTKAPNLKTGANRLSPMVGRELAVLLWALQEEGATQQLEAILHGWRELAREERWWLFAKAAAPGQRTGVGWRRALFHALSEATDTRAVTPPTEKKSQPQSRPLKLERQPAFRNLRKRSSTIKSNPQKRASESQKPDARRATENPS